MMLISVKQVVGSEWDPTEGSIMLSFTFDQLNNNNMIEYHLLVIWGGIIWNKKKKTVGEHYGVTKV